MRLAAGAVPSSPSGPARTETTVAAAPPSGPTAKAKADIIARVRRVLSERERAAYACYLGFECEAPPRIVRPNNTAPGPDASGLAAAALDADDLSTVFSSRDPDAFVVRSAVALAWLSDIWSDASADFAEATFQHRGVPFYLHDVARLVQAAPDASRARDILAAAAKSEVTDARRAAFFARLEVAAGTRGLSAAAITAAAAGLSVDAFAAWRTRPASGPRVTLSVETALEVVRGGGRVGAAAPAGNIALLPPGTPGCFLLDAPHQVMLAVGGGDRAAEQYAIGCAAAGRRVNVEHTLMVQRVAWAASLASLTPPAQHVRRHAAVVAARAFGDLASTVASRDAALAQLWGGDAVPGLSLVLGAPSPSAALADVVGFEGASPDAIGAPALDRFVEGYLGAPNVLIEPLR